MIKIVICADDTDDISKKTSTGKVVEMIAKEIELLGGNTQLGITRHQLLLHDEIAYTSHNSSMCFEANVPKDKIEMSWFEACRVLKEEMAESSDPGLCLCRLDNVLNIDKLINFGRKAQQEVLNKDQAYSLAKETNVRLEEFGGIGVGVIGALAGVGLRLSGNDGTFRGGKRMSDLKLKSISIQELKQNLDVSDVITKNGDFLTDETIVVISNQVKLIYHNYKKIAMAKKMNNNIWEICDKTDLFDKDFIYKESIICCNNFMLDNDLEECLNNQMSCLNCLYRKWKKKEIFCCLND